MDITWNVKDCNGNLVYAVGCIRAGEYKASCSASKLALPDKIVAYRKIKPVFDDIRGIYKQIEGAYSLSGDLLTEMQAGLRQELKQLIEANFTIAPRKGYSVVTFKEAA